MRQKHRLRAGGLALLALGATAAFSASASASSPPDPQTTNVPNLAWSGEQIRLEKCFDASKVSDSSYDFSSARAEFLVESWSGGSQAPQIEDPTVKLFFAGPGRVCAMGDAISLDPGMARIELDVTDDAGVLGFTGWGPADPVLKHQFLAGWMTLNQPNLSELSASDFAGSAQQAATNTLGDPSGNGEFTPASKPGILRASITGSMPMNGDWGALVGKSTVTLPADWPTLANALATDSNPNDANPASRWDIHDDQTDRTGHVPTSGCPGTNAATIEAVDNCTGGPATGPFSTIFGLSSGHTVGPFDPVRPQDTLLSDGKLDSSDAPMPAARIDFTIAPNSGASGDISGVGSLAAQSKDQSYSRDFTGNPTPAGNLYAPFYNAYLPATAAGAVSSGIDGPSSGNNFPGFLNVDPLYHYWDIASTLASNGSTATQCLRRSADPQADTPTAHPGDYYQTPSGPSSVVVYTDEHGEAQVQYVPGTGYYFNSLINNRGAIVNADGGCDLQSLFNVPDSLGTASITATARYPYKPVNFPAQVSAPVHKSVTSLWSKTLAYFPKGAGDQNGSSRIVVAHAQDIDGTPFAGETVCFSSDGEGMTFFDGRVAGIDLRGTAPASDPKPGSLGRVCVLTDSHGNAAVEVLESHPIAVDVIADFANEGILRDISVDYTKPGTSGGTPPPANGSPTAPTTGGTTSPSNQVLSLVAPGLVPSGSPAVAGSSAKIALARLLSPAHGRHYLVIRVRSSANSVTLRVRLVLATGHSAGAGAHKTHVVTRLITIRTNRLVKIALASSVIRLGSVVIVN
jgi:hypothetical protein